MKNEKKKLGKDEVEGVKLGIKSWQIQKRHVEIEMFRHKLVEEYADAIAFKTIFKYIEDNDLEYDYEDLKGNLTETKTALLDIKYNKYLLKLLKHYSENPDLYTDEVRDKAVENIRQREQFIQEANGKIKQLKEMMKNV